MSRLPDFKAESAAEQARLGRPGAERLLDVGREWSRRWDLPATLLCGGAVIFPHIGLERCGAHTAAAVHAALDACEQYDVRRVLAIGVLHAITEELEQARVRVAAGADVTREVAWGIQGPGVSWTPGAMQPRDDWQNEFSLLDFLFLWRLEIARRGIRAPQLVLRYPCLAGGRPEILPRIEELAALVGRRAMGAVIVATADPFHHGIGYGDAPAVARSAEEGGLELARARIEEGLALLSDGRHWEYNQHCVAAKSDARDVGQVLRHLIGPCDGRILDLTWADTSAAYEQRPPTWVAGALIELLPRHSSDSTR